MKVPSLLLCIALLTGCAAAPPQMQISQLELYKSVRVPEGRTRVFIQQGRVVSRLDEFVPHCALEIRHLHGPPRTIQPGRYPVTRVQQVLTEVVLGSGARQLADVGVGIHWHLGGIQPGDSPPALFEGYHFWLQDVDNVGLLRLTCLGQREMPWDVQPPTLEELAQALAGIGRLTVRE